MTPADITVVIPALNESDAIHRTVRSAFAGGAGEVIVVDGGSRDGTAAAARDDGARVVECSAGRGRQLAAGAAAARGEMLLFLHADNWLSPGCLQQLVASVAGDAQCWGAFRQRIDAPQFCYRWLEVGNAARVRLVGLPFGDQALFVPRALYEKVGGFPDEPLMEDVILARRLRRLRRPVLLPGPLHVSPRRWQRHGVVRQTVRNWTIQLAFRLGVSPRRLVSYYERANP